MSTEDNVSEDVPESVPKREQKIGNTEIHADEGTVEAFDASKCPIIEPHVADFQKCCREYAEGKQTDLDVIVNVVQTLRKLRGESHE